MRIFYLIVLGWVVLGVTNTAWSQTTDRPNLKEGDKWIYSVRVDENKADTMASSTRNWDIMISRAGLNTLSVARKPVDSNLPAREFSYNTDWSVTRNVAGKNTVTSKDYDFPLITAKTWKTEVIEEKLDAQTKSQKTTWKYTVLGWEDVIVPAGTFKALKIEADGEWTKEFEPRGPSVSSSTGATSAGSSIVMQSINATTAATVSGRLYKAIWYVPEIKRDVKLVDESMNSQGILSKRTTQELHSYSLK